MSNPKNILVITLGERDVQFVYKRNDNELVRSPIYLWKDASAQKQKFEATTEYFPLKDIEIEVGNRSKGGIDQLELVGFVFPMIEKTLKKLNDDSIPVSIIYLVATDRSELKDAVIKLKDSLRLKDSLIGEPREMVKKLKKRVKDLIRHIEKDITKAYSEKIAAFWDGSVFLKKRYEICIVPGVDLSIIPVCIGSGFSGFKVLNEKISLITKKLNAANEKEKLTIIVKNEEKILSVLADADINNIPFFQKAIAESLVNQVDTLRSADSIVLSISGGMPLLSRVFEDIVRRLTRNYNIPIEVMSVPENSYISSQFFSEISIYDLFPDHREKSRDFFLDKVLKEFNQGKLNKTTLSGALCEYKSYSTIGHFLDEIKRSVLFKDLSSFNKGEINPREIERLVNNNIRQNLESCRLSKEMNDLLDLLCDTWVKLKGQPYRILGHITKSNSLPLRQVKNFTKKYFSVELIDDIVNQSFLIKLGKIDPKTPTLLFIILLGILKYSFKDAQKEACISIQNHSSTQDLRIDIEFDTDRESIAYPNIMPLVKSMNDKYHNTNKAKFGRWLHVLDSFYEIISGTSDNKKIKLVVKK